MDGEWGGSSSSEPDPDIESSSRVRGGGFVDWDFDLGGGLVVVRRFEAGWAEEESFRFFWEAGVVKKEDMKGD